MILSYRDKRAQQFAQGEFVRVFQGFEHQAERRLAILNATPSLDTLRILPSNRLEALRGDRSGQYSIRINQQWRLCFVWPDGELGPSDVEIVDYHRQEKTHVQTRSSPRSGLKGRVGRARCHAD